MIYCVHVVVKTLNLEVSRCRCLSDDVKEYYWSACYTRSRIIFPHSANQIIAFSCCCCRCRCPCLNSLRFSGCNSYPHDISSPSQILEQFRTLKATIFFQNLVYLLLSGLTITLTLKISVSVSAFFRKLSVFFYGIAQLSIWLHLFKV